MDSAGEPDGDPDGDPEFVTTGLNGTELVPDAPSMA
jgi:hypothetical protein